MSHALLSPSAASRWLSCTPSARLETQFPDNASEAAAEGTLAHRICELTVMLYAGRITEELYHAHMRKEILPSKYYCPEMQEHCEEYATYVIGRYEMARSSDPAAVLMLEVKLDLTKYVPEGFGTGDTVILANNIVEIIDFKYGKGVPVSAVNNSQLKIYALGAIDMFGFAYELRMVNVTIVQPRLKSLTSHPMTIEELQAWADSELLVKAALAWKGEGDFVAGKHCQFCKAKAVCRANMEFNMQVAAHDFANAETLCAEEIADIISRADMFKSWIGAVEEYALKEALGGKRIPGYKIVQGRSTRQYSDELAVANILTGVGGYTETDIYNKKLLGITAMEKLLGKDRFAHLLDSHIVKPAGKPTLVTESDPRKPFNSAELDFAGIILEND